MSRPKSSCKTNYTSFNTMLSAHSFRYACKEPFLKIDNKKKNKLKQNINKRVRDLNNRKVTIKLLKDSYFLIHEFY